MKNYSSVVLLCCTLVHSLLLLKLMCCQIEIIDMIIIIHS